jgi:hypothetical protein
MEDCDGIDQGNSHRMVKSPTTGTSNNAVQPYGWPATASFYSSWFPFLGQPKLTAGVRLIDKPHDLNHQLLTACIPIYQRVRFTATGLGVLVDGVPKQGLMLNRTMGCRRT